MSKNKNSIFRRCGFISASLLVFFIGGLAIADSQKNTINHYLNIKTYKVVDDGSASNVDTNYFKSTYNTEQEVKDAFQKKAIQAEEEGLVLLKNDNSALPLKSNPKVSFFGTASAKVNYSVSGSSSTSGVTYPTLEESMNKAGIQVNPSLMAFYKTGKGASYGRTNYMLVGQANECPYSEIDSSTLSSVESYGDAGIMMIARDSGEGSDIGTTNSDGLDGTYLSMSKDEISVLKGMSQLKKEGKLKKTIVILNTSCTLQTDFLSQEGVDIDALLWIGNVGSYGLDGVANVLAGKAVPSGKLSETYLKNNLSSPAMMSWMSNPGSRFTQKYKNSNTYSLNATQANYAIYQEGIYVGYRYYETRYEDYVTKKGNAGNFSYSDVVSYPFGYGLSYTNFEYSSFQVTEKEDTYEVSVDVKNVGNTYSGKDVVEVYLQKPYTDYDIENGIEKASVELVGFAKTGLIAPNGSETVKIEVDKEEFKSYDANKAKTYILDEGKYYLSIGNGVHDALNNILALKGYNSADGMDQDGKASLAKNVLEQDRLDDTTYSVSKETGKKITNQLDFMDINRYENRGDNKVTYVSRHDWEETIPKENVVLSVSDEKMAYDLSSNKEMEEKSEDSMPTFSAENGLQLIALRNTDEKTYAYDDPLWDNLLDELSYEEMSNLLTSAGFSTINITSVGKPGTKDNDGPTAIVGTKTGSVLPSKGIIASTFNKTLIQEIGDVLAEDTRLAGYQSIYAPGINIHRTPFGGRSNEYYSEDPFLSGAACVAEVTGLQKKGVIPTIKHFAFNNEETNRNGVCIWMNEQEAREIMLKPYEMALRPSMGNGHAIMTSFNRAGCIWTSASSNLMININRDEFGFDGYSLTDMAASNAGAYMLYNDGIYNGTDLFLGTGSESALKEYKNNATFVNRVRDSAHRVLYVICNFSAAMNGISPSGRIVNITPWWKSLLIALIIAFAVIAVVLYTLYFIFEYKKKKED